MFALSKYITCSKRGLPGAMFKAFVFEAVFLLIYLFEDLINLLKDRAWFGTSYPVFVVEYIGVVACIFSQIAICSNLFKFGVANSSSRRSITAVTMLSVPLQALVTAVVTELMAVIMSFGAQVFNWKYSIYGKLFGSYKSEDGMRMYSDELSDEISAVIIEVGFIFAVMCAISYCVCLIYAMYVKFGRCGILGGIALCEAVYMLMHFAVESRGSFHQKMKSIYIMPSVRDDIMYELAPLPVLLTLVAIAILTSIAYTLCMKRSTANKKEM